MFIIFNHSCLLLIISELLMKVLTKRGGLTGVGHGRRLEVFTLNISSSGVVGTWAMCPSPCLSTLNVTVGHT